MKRKTITLSGRLSASLVALSLAFQPIPAYALRTETAQEAGLEETLTQALKDPAQAFKEFTQEVTGLATSPAAGLEEERQEVQDVLDALAAPEAQGQAWAAQKIRERLILPLSEGFLRLTPALRPPEVSHISGRIKHFRELISIQKDVVERLQKVERWGMKLSTQARARGIHLASHASIGLLIGHWLALYREMMMRVDLTSVDPQLPQVMGEGVQAISELIAEANRLAGEIRKLSTSVPELLSILDPNAGLEETQRVVLEKLVASARQRPPPRVPVAVLGFLEAGGDEFAALRVSYTDPESGISVQGFLPLASLFDAPYDLFSEGTRVRWARSRIGGRPISVLVMPVNWNQRFPAVFRGEIPISEEMLRLELSSSDDERAIDLFLKRLKGLLRSFLREDELLVWLERLHQDRTFWRSLSFPAQVSIARLLTLKNPGFSDQERLRALSRAIAEDPEDNLAVRTWALQAMFLSAGPGQLSRGYELADALWDASFRLLRRGPQTREALRSIVARFGGPNKDPWLAAHPAALMENSKLPSLVLPRDVPVFLQMEDHPLVLHYENEPLRHSRRGTGSVGGKNLLLEAPRGGMIFLPSAFWERDRRGFRRKADLRRYLEKWMKKSASGISEPIHAREGNVLYLISAEKTKQLLNREPGALSERDFLEQTVELRIENRNDKVLAFSLFSAAGAIRVWVKQQQVTPGTSFKLSQNDVITFALEDSPEPAGGLEEGKTEPVAQPPEGEGFTVKEYFRWLLKTYGESAETEGAQFFVLRITGLRDGLQEFEIPVAKLRSRKQHELGLFRILRTLRQQEEIQPAFLARERIQPIKSQLYSDDRGSWRRVIVRAIPAAGLEKEVEAGQGQRILVEGAEDRLVIFTPATAVTALEVLAGLESPPERPLQVAFVVEDSAQEAQVRAGLEQAGLAAVEIVNLSVTGQTVWDAVAGLQFWAWSRARQLETFVVDTLERFWDLGRWLKVPRISWRALLERVRWVSTATQA